MEACIPGIPCLPGAKTATVCVCGVCDDDNDGGTHDNAVTTVCRWACLSKRTSFGTFHFLLGFRKDTPRSSRHLELLGASIELLGASLELLGASLELRGAALELLGASIELLGASLELRGAALELLGASIELITCFASLCYVRDHSSTDVQSRHCPSRATTVAVIT